MAKIHFVHRDQRSADLFYDEEIGDEMLTLCDGKTPVYILFSNDDEAYFISSAPIDTKGILEQYPDVGFILAGL